jgi:hypothetical protein
MSSLLPDFPKMNRAAKVLLVLSAAITIVEHQVLKAQTEMEHQMQSESGSLGVVQGFQIEKINPDDVNAASHSDDSEASHSDDSEAGGEGQNNDISNGGEGQNNDIVNEEDEPSPKTDSNKDSQSHSGE